MPGYDDEPLPGLGDMFAAGMMRPTPGPPADATGIVQPFFPSGFMPPKQWTWRDVRRAQEEQAAKVKELSQLGTALRMINEEGRSGLVGPDMSEPGKFRFTRFDETGAPYNHSTYGVYEHAIEDALREKYRVK